MNHQPNGDMGTEHFDAIVVGSGQAGNPLAKALSEAGRRTALVEREHVGGTCINVGCTPTKTMVASARVAYLARRAGDYGVNTGEVSVDLAAVGRRKEAVVKSFREGSERRLQDAEVTLVEGQGRFTAPKTLVVTLNEGGERTLTAPMIFLNTGSRSARPDLPGLDEVPALDSTSIMELEEVPGHLLVLGGGYVGLEFAQMFRRFGSEVTVVQRGPRLLDREDPDVADAVAEILREDGIEVLLGAEAKSVRREAGEVELKVKAEDGDKVLRGTHLLLAAGRTPNTDDLNLQAAGVETDDRGFVSVNERLETGAEGIWAMGDVKGGPAFTHISYDDYRILRANLLDGGDRSTEGRMVPYVVFTDPQLGRVGMSEKEATEAGKKIKIAKMPMSSVARAIETDETRGVVKAVVDAETEKILGAAVLGLEGGEVMSAIQLAMMGGLPYTTLRDGIFAHPTLAELLNNLFTDLKDPE